MGVYVRKGKRGTTYSIDFYADGVRKRLGGFKTKTEAQKALEAARTDARRGLLNIAAPESSPGFQDFAEEYFAWQKARKRSWERDQVILKHLCLFFGNRPLSQITPRDVEAYKASRLQAGMSKPTVDRELSVLRHLFNTAMEWKQHNENPVLSKAFFREYRKRWHILSADEEARLLEAAPPWLAPFLLFCLYTGFRRGQVLALRWEWVDFHKREVCLPAEVNKDKKDHRLPLGPTAIQVLRSLSRDSDRCFGYIDESTLHVNFKKALKRAGLSKTIRLHDLRHSFGSRCLATGNSIEVTRRLMQHASLVTTQLYVHSTEEEERKALERLRPSEKIVTNGHKFTLMASSLVEKSLRNWHNLCW